MSFCAKNQKVRSAFITKQLDHFFPDPQPPLDHSCAFTLLIAVLLSAQCTDARVNLVTPALFAKAPTPQTMQYLTEQEIFECIQTCGLAKSKSRYIKELSQQICEEFAGQVPSTMKELESLSGVGHKTAGVVLCQAFGKNAFPVDTHILRCAERWGLSKSKSVSGVEKDLKKAFPESLWGKIHLQIIYFARQFCPARMHVASQCPICQHLAKKD